MRRVLVVLAAALLFGVSSAHGESISGSGATAAISARSPVASNGLGLAVTVVAAPDGSSTLHFLNGEPAEHPIYQVPDACALGLHGAGPNSLLFACSTTAFDLRVLNLSTGEVTSAPGLARVRHAAGDLCDGCSLSIDTTGAYWVRLVSRSYPGAPAQFRYLNWQTGQVRGEQHARSAVVDLDTPSLLRRLCRPLRLEQDVQTADSAAPPVWVSAVAVAHPSGSSRYSTVELRRCGSNTAMRLSRAGKEVLKSGPTTITYETMTSLRVVEIASGAAHTQSLPASRFGTNYHELTTSPDSVYVSVHNRDNTWLIYKESRR